MNKLAVSIAVALALGLTACDDSLKDIKEEIGDKTVKPASRVVFDPGAATPRLSVPNDLLFQGTTDGTLTTDSGATPNYTDPQVALGALDGWSTQNPFTIAVDLPAETNLVATSVQLPGAVRLFEVVMQDPTSADDDCRTPNRGFACKVVSELVFGQDFVTSVSGSNIIVAPLKPLKPATTYMTVLTSLIQDNNEQSLAPSTSYELVKQDDDTLPLSSPSQLALQRLINSFEDVIEAEGVDRETIVYTAAMTTQSAGAVLSTVKQLMLPSALNNNTPPMVLAASANMRVSKALLGLEDATIPDNPAHPAFFFKAAQLYNGTINLPYYLGGSAEAPMAALSGRWEARCDTGVVIAALSAEQKAALAAAIETEEQIANDQYCNGASKGALRDFGLDSVRHLTKFNVIPKVKSDQTLNVQITVPDEDLLALIGRTKPAAGWPVVILQHGITSKKEDMLALTASLTARGYATVAIDHPLHGSRGFGPVNASSSQANPAGNATAYMNLQNLLVTRDNLRQSIADMMGLRLGLNFSNLVQTQLINPTEVHVVGHSLGAITTSSMVALANTPIQNPDLTEQQLAQINGLYRVQTATLAMPGGAVANFLLESPRFSPTVKASILYAAGGALAERFINYAEPITDCGAAPYVACFNQFVAELDETADAEYIATMEGVFTRFAFAAQTVTDSGDPNNYAQRLVVSETPTYIIEVAGNANNLPDQVIPNGYANPLAALALKKMPLAGTEPLARLLSAQALPAEAGSYGLEGANVIARFSEGDHSSVLSPASSAAATTEMQSQLGSFILTQGQGLVVTDSTVLVPTN